MMRATMLGTGEGGGGSPIQLGNQVIEAFGSGSTSASVTFRSDGVLRITEDGVTRDITEQWHTDPSGGIGSSYDVRCSEIISGDSFSAEAAAVETYIQMNADRTWTVTTTSQRITNATFQIVDTGGSAVLAEANFAFFVVGT